MNEALEIGLRTAVEKRVKSIFTSKAQVNTSAAAYADLRNILIAANTFREGEHLVYKGGGFVLCTGGNVTQVDFRLRFGGIDVHLVGFAPGAPGAFPWFMEGIITQNSDIGGVFFWNNANFNVTRGELPGWPGPTADMNLQLQAQIAVSAGTGIVANETWNVVKYPNAG